MINVKFKYKLADDTIDIADVQNRSEIIIGNENRTECYV